MSTVIAWPRTVTFHDDERPELLVIMSRVGRDVYVVPMLLADGAAVRESFELGTLIATRDTRPDVSIAHYEWDGDDWVQVTLGGVPLTICERVIGRLIPRSADMTSVEIGGEL